MSMSLIIILVLAAIALIIGVILAAGDRGSRVTQIDHTIRREEEDRD